METTYEFILRLKQAQCWEGCKCLFSQASTLERYSRVYELSLQLEPEKNHGYLKRLLENPDIVHLLGAPDVAHLKIALHKMRRPMRAR